MRVLLTNPEVDILTYYLSAWTKSTINELRIKSNKYHYLKREKVTRKFFESILNKRQIDLVLLCGHGTSDSVFGNDETILDFENAGLLKNKVVHALSCQSADKLGPNAVAKGAKAYIGYKNDFIAFIDDSKRVSKPLEDGTASLFLKPAFATVRALLKGSLPEEAVSLAKKAYNKSIRDALNSDVQSDADQFINWLFWDRDNLICCK